MVDHVGCNCWVDWMGTITEDGRGEEVGTWFSMLGVGEVVQLVDRWERAEHITAVIGELLQ